MNKFNATILFAVTAVLFISSCAFTQVNALDNRQEALAAVKAVLGAYENYSKADFQTVIADDFMPLRSEFMNKVDTAAYAQQSAEFDISVEQVLIREGKMSVAFRWFKKYTVSGSPGQQKSQGDAEFVFSLVNGQWKLSRINGDNPF